MWFTKMSNNAKIVSLSIAELKRQLEQKLLDKNKSAREANIERDLSADLVAFIEEELGSGDNCDSKAQFESWVNRVRVSGPLFNQRIRHPRFLDLRRNVLIRNSDALNESVLRKLSRDFEKRWIYTESEAQKIFGDYLVPLELGNFIFRISGPRDLLKELTGIVGGSREDVTLLCPSPSLIEVLSYYSAKVDFMTSFVVGDVQRRNSEKEVKGRKAHYPPINFEVSRMLSDRSSPLQRALNAPIPPRAELAQLALQLGIKLGSDGRRPSLVEIGNKPLHFIFQTFRNLFPLGSASGAVSLVVNPAKFQVNLICAPAVFQAMLDSLQNDNSAVAGKNQMYASQNVMLALGDSEREEAIALIYGAATRGDLQVTQEGRLTAASLGKIGSAVWPAIATSLTRDLIEFVVSFPFERYEGLVGADHAKCCMPEDIFFNAQSVLRQLASFPYINSFIRLFAAAPDRTWIDLSDAPLVLGIRQDSDWYEHGGRYQAEEFWTYDCLFGWFCGLVDLAFDVDKKGIKTNLRAFRVNRAALKRATTPNPDEHALEDPQIAEKQRSRYGNKVEVLPNGEVLCPPNLHPAIKFCLATVLPYARANTFSVYPGKTKPHLALDLTSSDVLGFLELISRNPVPKIVSDKLSEPVGGKVASIGALAPDFVITGASHDRAQAVLNEVGDRRFFAVEMAKDVWGFFDRYASRSPHSLDTYKVGGTLGRRRELDKAMKNLSKGGIVFVTNISDLDSIGAIPTTKQADCYRRGQLNKPSLQPFSRYCEFFDLKLDDPHWDSEKIGVEIFSLVPAEIRATKVFTVAMTPCIEIMKTLMDYL
jgi:hypothetical protein